MTTSATGPAPGSVSGQPMPPALVGTNPIANGQQTGYAAGTVNGPGAGPTAVQTAALPPPTTTPAAYGTPTAPAPVTTAQAAAAVGGGGTITAQPGDTLYSLSRQYGVSVAAIAAANGLTQTSTLTIGQRLVIPSPDSPAGRVEAPLGAIPTAAGTPGATPVQRQAPAATQPTQVAAATQTPGQHAVQNGETIYSIATAYGISPNALMQANGMAQAELLRVGQVLTIPGATRAPATTTSAPVTAAAPPIATPTPTPQPVAAAPTPVATPAPAAAPTQQVAATTTTNPPATGAASTNGTTFRWPLQGRIISDFGPKPGGERNDGINLAAPEGADIRAAEAGTVIYAGNEIPGYGNLILIRHADNFVTAYAHTSAMLVAKDQTVTRGQVIGRVGQTGSVTSPQLHFELRRGSTPINPMDYLTN